MTKYTVFLIPENKEKYPAFLDRVVVKRLREKTNEKLLGRGYKHLGIVEAKVKKEARGKANSLALGIK